MNHFSFSIFGQCFEKKINKISFLQFFSFISTYYFHALSRWRLSQKHQQKGEKHGSL